jgi:hypothetical protein
MVAELPKKTAGGGTLGGGAVAWEAWIFMSNRSRSEKEEMPGGDDRPFFMRAQHGHRLGGGSPPANWSRRAKMKRRASDREVGVEESWNAIMCRANPEHSEALNRLASRSQAEFL